MTPKLERLDKWLLWAVCITIVIVVGVNFATSYGHIFREALLYGELGFEAALTPIGIDGMLLALGLANVLAAKFGESPFLLRAALAFGVAGTIAANAAYGAAWGMTGGLLATWSPLALFITVESGLYVFRLVGRIIAKASEAADEPKRKPGRPVGSRNKPKPSEAPQGASEATETPDPQLPLTPVLKGTVQPMDPFHDLRKTGQIAAIEQ